MYKLAFRKKGKTIQYRTSNKLTLFLQEGLDRVEEDTIMEEEVSEGHKREKLLLLNLHQARAHIDIKEGLSTFYF